MALKTRTPDRRRETHRRDPGRSGLLRPSLPLSLGIACCALGLLLGAPAQAAKPGGGANPTCQITQAVANPVATGCNANEVCVAVGGTVQYTGKVTGGSAPYSVTWTLNGGQPPSATGSIPASGGTHTTGFITYNTAGAYSTLFAGTDSANKNCNASQAVRVVATQTDISINSTSDNGGDPNATTSVGKQTIASTPGYSLLGVNDLGIHCADLDSRVFSILPPFNVIHATTVKKGTTGGPPQILTAADVEIYYSAASNDKDPVFDGAPTRVDSVAGDGTVYKGNFWDTNPRTGNIIGFDLYDAFYPDGVLDPYNTPNSRDYGLPVPDLAQLYPPGATTPSGILVAGQQAMPGVANPYVVNDPQVFDRYDDRLPFFVGFPFGYELTGLNWFAADGIPIEPVDDKGRENAYPLMRLQAKAKVGNSLGLPAGTTLASVDTVVPISIEADCKVCHTSVADGGNGQAACYVGLDAGCTVEGSARSSTAFNVVSPSEDPSAAATFLQSDEWAADINIVRLHDAKHGTVYNCTPASAATDPECLQNRTPIACQSCHYTPALDLAHVGPSDDNGKSQTSNKSFSNVMHGHHGQFTDLFPLMPAPVQDAAGNVTNQAARESVLDQTCYGCHPGNRTQCLRGAMFQGDILCQDCHGDMSKVGNDFSQNVSPSNPGAFIVAGDFYTNPSTPRVPWANEPTCGSCHTGDAVSSLRTDPNVVVNKTDVNGKADNLRLLRAYRSNDANAKPILASNRRFAENEATSSGTTKQVLYRLSTGHGGLFCEACHGPTHAEWPVTPRTGAFVANDNTTATQLQGHDGKLQECDVCHTRDSTDPRNLTMPLGLNGPHGMHPVNDNRWNHQHRNYTGGGGFSACKVCHMNPVTGALTGSVLSTTSATRVVDCKTTAGSFPDCAAGSPTATVPAGTQVGCGNCHRQK